MSIITPTLWLTIGLTFYGGDFVNQPTACGDVYTESLGMFAAVPVEWVRSGAVSCHDTLFAKLADGKEVEVIIRDTGCHLHHYALDTQYPYGADFSIYGRDGTPTGIGRIAVRHRDGNWWDLSNLSLDAEAIDVCYGPRSMSLQQVIDKRKETPIKIVHIVLDKIRVTVYNFSQRGRHEQREHTVIKNHTSARRRLERNSTLQARGASSRHRTLPKQAYGGRRALCQKSMARSW